MLKLSVKDVSRSVSKTPGFTWIYRKPRRSICERERRFSLISNATLEGIYINKIVVELYSSSHVCSRFTEIVNFIDRLIFGILVICVYISL